MWTDPIGASAPAVFNIDLKNKEVAPLDTALLSVSTADTNCTGRVLEGQSDFREHAQPESRLKGGQRNKLSGLPLFLSQLHNFWADSADAILSGALMGAGIGAVWGGLLGAAAFSTPGAIAGGLIGVVVGSVVFTALTYVFRPRSGPENFYGPQYKGHLPPKEKSKDDQRKSALSSGETPTSCERFKPDVQWAEGVKKWAKNVDNFAKLDDEFSRKLKASKEFKNSGSSLVEAAGQKTIKLGELLAWKASVIPRNLLQGFVGSGLENLDMSSCLSCESLPSGLFENLESLKMLNLSDNRHDKQEPYARHLFRELGWQDREEKVRRYISLPSLSSLQDGVFNGLTGLEHLNLSSNKLGELKLGALRGLGALKKLDVRGNNISDWSALSALETLEVLDIRGNIIEDLPKEVLAALPKLKKLNGKEVER